MNNDFLSLNSFVHRTQMIGAMIFCLFGSTQVVADTPVQFNRDVRPILSDNCFACHGPDANHRKAKLRLDRAADAYAKRDDDRAAITPGNLQASEVWQRIVSDDPDVVMPPPGSHKSLTAEQKRTIKKWIEQGAKFEKHWSFENFARPALPKDWRGHAIDYFVRQRLQDAGLTPSPRADRATLLRRVSIDLIGLPPTLAEMDAFLADESPDAYEKQVDRLLASPHFGERMAVQWLDAARYGDTNGYLHDKSRTSWPWRDWVIHAFNQNMPFDQFVIEQLAGDQLANATDQQKLATSFGRNHLITTEGGTIAEEYLNEYASDRVETYGTVFLGLTFNCARCHDHKFDPVAMDDYYSLQAYFNSIEERHAVGDRSPTYAPWVEVTSPLAPDAGKIKVMTMKDKATPTPTFVLNRGVYDQADKTRPVTRRPPALFGDATAADKTNRLGLAKWTVSKDNPLLARVTVNRIWQRFFSKGIVHTIDDFGVQGAYPTHPKLLDYLAAEIRDGSTDGATKPWDFKHLVRLIVTSETYKQSSIVRDEVIAKDPENKWLAVFPRRRLSAEEIRDQALLVSGLLSRRLGGPPVRPYQPPGLWRERANRASNTKVYRRQSGEALYRRSVYTFIKRTCPPPLMSIFDGPDRTTCSVQRTATNTPLQALALLNDEQFLECAKMLAVQTLQAKNKRLDRLKFLFRSVTGRSPNEKDLATMTRGLEKLLARYRAAPEDAKALLAQGEKPVPADLDAAEIAAWMLVANAVLNLDETLVRD